MSKVQERCLGADPHLFIELPNEIELLLCSGPDRTQRPDAPQRPVTPSPVTPMAAMCPRLILSHRVPTVT
jgi:hypothetical protein